MGRVTSVDCGEVQDCGSVIELGAKLHSITRTEDGASLYFSQIGDNEQGFISGSFNFFLVQEELWYLDLDPGDTYDVLFVRRDTAGDNVSDQ